MIVGMDIAIHVAKFSRQTAGRDKIYRYCYLLLSV